MTKYSMTRSIARPLCDSRATCCACWNKLILQTWRQTNKCKINDSVCNSVCDNKNAKQEVWPPGSADTLCPRRPLMTQVQHWAKTAQSNHVILRPWLLTLKLVCESHKRWGTWFLKLLAMCATDRRTKATIIAPFPTSGGVTSSTKQAHQMSPRVTLQGAAAWWI